MFQSFCLSILPIGARVGHHFLNPVHREHFDHREPHPTEGSEGRLDEEPGLCTAEQVPLHQQPAQLLQLQKQSAAILTGDVRDVTPGVMRHVTTSDDVTEHSLPRAHAFCSRAVGYVPLAVRTVTKC